MKFVRTTLSALLLILGFVLIPSSAHASTASQQEVTEIVIEAAHIFKISPECHLARARRESGLNPNAINGTHKGIFQQKQKYWLGRVREYNANVAEEHRVSENIWDPVANARVSARMVGLPKGWTHWGRRCG